MRTCVMQRGLPAASTIPEQVAASSAVVHGCCFDGSFTQIPPVRFPDGLTLLLLLLLLSAGWAAPVLVIWLTRTGDS